MDCEAHPIPVHPAAHPMLKMKTVDTVIPTVYRFGKMDLVPTPAAPQVAEEESTKPLPVPSRLPTPQPAVDKAPVALPEAPQVDLNLGGDLRSEFSHLLEPVTVQPVVPQAESTLIDVSATPATVCSGLSNEALLVAPTGTETPVSAGFVNDVDAIRRLQENLTSGYSTPIIMREPQATMPGGMPEEPLMESSTVWPEMLQKDNVAATVPAVINPVPSADPTPSPSVTTPVPLVAKFVSDLNIADGQIFPPGAEFVKSWILENVGGRAWPEATQLRFVAGDRMGVESQIVIGAVPANSQATISTPELKAPEKPGRYVAYWRLFDGEGAAFGTSVWIE
jgi:next-to-BRCA1 protein 1